VSDLFGRRAWATIHANGEPVDPVVGPFGPLWLIGGDDRRAAPGVGVAVSDLTALADRLDGHADTCTLDLHPCFPAALSTNGRTTIVTNGAWLVVPLVGDWHDRALPVTAAADVAEVMPAGVIAEICDLAAAVAVTGACEGAVLPGPGTRPVNAGYLQNLMHTEEAPWRTFIVTVRDDDGRLQAAQVWLSATVEGTVTGHHTRWIAAARSGPSGYAATVAGLEAVAARGGDRPMAVLGRHRPGHHPFQALLAPARTARVVTDPTRFFERCAACGVEPSITGERFPPWEI